MKLFFFKINSKPFQVHSVAGKFESPREGTGDDFHWNSIEKKNKQKKQKEFGKTDNNLKKKTQ